MHHGNNFWWGMPSVWFTWVPLLTVLIVVIIILTNQNKTKQHKDSPMDILKKRYARGEITKEQLEEMKKEI